MKSKRSRQPFERVVLVVALALLLFATPVLHIWAHHASPWYLIYVIWLVIIGLSAWLYFTPSDDDF